MATASLEQLYPFSTAEGTPIPLDIIRATGVIIKSYNQLAAAAVVFPASMQLAAFYSQKDCLVQFGDDLVPPVDGVHQELTLYVPAHMVVMAVVPTLTGTVLGLSEAGTLIIQGVYKWAGIALARQVSHKT